MRVFGEGSYGKAKEIATTEGSKALKSTFRHKKVQLTKVQEKKYLEKAEKDILNEHQKLQEIHKDGKVPGVQYALEHTVIIIQGKAKNLQTKMGHIGASYSGNAYALENDWTPKWSPKELLKGVQSLTEGLKICHKEKGIYFGDIKGENIFRNDSTKELLLADLGGSQNKQEIWDDKNKKVVPSTASVFATCGYDLVKAESIKNSIDCAKLKEKMDVFSLGVFLFELFAKKMINTEDHRHVRNCVGETLTNNQILQALKRKLPENVAKELGSLIVDMTHLDDKQRLSSEEANERMLKIVERFAV